MPSGDVTSNGFLTFCDLINYLVKLHVYVHTFSRPCFCYDNHLFNNGQDGGASNLT